MVTPTFRSLRISHPFNCHNPTNEYVRLRFDLQNGFDIERLSFIQRNHQEMRNEKKKQKKKGKERKEK